MGGFDVAAGGRGHGVAGICGAAKLSFMVRGNPLLLFCFFTTIGACATGGGQADPAPVAADPAPAEDASAPDARGRDENFSFALGSLPATLEVVQGLAVKIKIDLVRGKTMLAPVEIKLRDFRDGITATPVSITGDSGEIEISAPSAAPQGPAAGTIEASAVDPKDPTRVFKVALPLKALVRGAPGAVDTTYGTAGIVRDVFGAGNDARIDDLVLAPDDSVYIVAHCAAAGVCVRHLDASGKIDMTYGGGGTATLALVSPHQAALQSDGKLVIVGGTPPSTAMIGRLDAKGVPDGSFGTGPAGSGTSVVQSGGLNGLNEGLVAVAIRADGDIFAAWDNNHDTIYKNGLMRIAPNGTLRAEYGAGGTSRNAPGRSTAMLVRNDVKSPSKGNVALVWVDTTAVKSLGFMQTNGDTGGVDPLIGPTPKTYALSQAWRPTQGAYGLVELADGSIVTPILGGGGVYLVKLSAVGGLVAGFGSGGIAGPFTSSRPNAEPNGIAVLPDGKLLVSIGHEGGLELLRFTTTGALDPGFGTNGRITQLTGTNSVGRKVVVQKSGRILAGSSTLTAPIDSGVSAFWP